MEMDEAMKEIDASLENCRVGGIHNIENLSREKSSQEIENRQLHAAVGGWNVSLKSVVIVLRFQILMRQKISGKWSVKPKSVLDLFKMHSILMKIGKSELPEEHRKVLYLKHIHSLMALGT